MAQADGEMGLVVAEGTDAEEDLIEYSKVVDRGGNGFITAAELMLFFPCGVADLHPGAAVGPAGAALASARVAVRRATSSGWGVHPSARHETKAEETGPSQT